MKTFFVSRINCGVLRIMDKLKSLKVKIFLDAANIPDFKKYRKLPFIKGFTTNPTLMKKSGVNKYEEFIRSVLPMAENRPISFGVISYDFKTMKEQAVRLSRMGNNIYVKIPIMNTRGESSAPLIRDLRSEGIKVNVTAVMTLKQVRQLWGALQNETPTIISIFSGRIADTGIDPAGIIKEARKILKRHTQVELLWASPRELINVFQADEAGCDIITVLPEILSKFHLIDYDLDRFSRDTVKMFYQDALSLGLKI